MILTKWCSTFLLLLVAPTKLWWRKPPKSGYVCYLSKGMLLPRSYFEVKQIIHHLVVTNVFHSLNMSVNYCKNKDGNDNEQKLVTTAVEKEKRKRYTRFKIAGNNYLPVPRKWFVHCLGLLACLSSFAQEAVRDSGASQKKVFGFSAGVNSGFVIVHSKDVAFTKGSRPLGIELGASWQRNDSQSVNICNCYPKKGVVFNYYNMGNEHLGKLFSAAYFLEPVYRINRSMMFSFKAVVGLVYGTNPYDSILNPINHAYSLPVSAYLMLGAGIYFRINDHLSLNTSLNFNHASNGGMKLPNKGIDWPTAGLTLNYQMHAVNYYSGKRSKSKDWKTNSIRWDAGLFGIVNKQLDENHNERFFPLIGVEFSGSRQIGNLNALNLGTEIFYDPGHAMEVKVNQAVIANPVRAGVLFGHEFLLGKFIFSQKLGYYYFSEMPYERFYHRWALGYRITRHWGAGFSLLAHKQVADFFNVKVTYSLQKRNNTFNR
jgi:hypothetical protein